MMDTQNQDKNIEQLEKLREPFPESAISKLPKGNVTLDFVGHANVTDRLLNIDLFYDWQPLSHDELGQPVFEYNAQGHAVGFWIKLTVCGVTRLGYGTCTANKNDAKKELIGDALRNAAMRFGVALNLWSKAELESQHDENAPQQDSLPQQRPQPTNGTSRPAAVNGAQNGQAQKPVKLSAMQELMQQCERFKYCIDGEGKAVVKHIQNVLEKEGHVIAVTPENLKTAWSAIKAHYEAKSADTAADPNDTLFAKEVAAYPSN